MAIIKGTSRADLITATTISSGVTGGLATAGYDSIDGGDGDDTIDGGGGLDTFRGGAGNDLFVWSMSIPVGAPAYGLNTTRIMDFSEGDRIDLSGFGIGSMATVWSLLSESYGSPLAL